MSRQYPIDRKSLYTESDRADSFVGRSTPYTRAGTDVTKRKNQSCPEPLQCWMSGKSAKPHRVGLVRTASPELPNSAQWL